MLLLPQRYIFSSKSQLVKHKVYIFVSCCCYHKGTYFQANHNRFLNICQQLCVVVATTKVHIFKQITTPADVLLPFQMLLLLPQRYIFSSKSQQQRNSIHLSKSCCCYHKGTYFQANHNSVRKNRYKEVVVVATTKVHIFKQITTRFWPRNRF